VAEKTVHEEENAKLRARIDELEAQLKSKRKSTTSTTKTASDAWSDATRSKRDSANRMVRGLTMASIESVRLVADAVSSFADGVASRNDSRDKDHKTTRDLVSNLPADIAGSFADAVTDFVEIPAKTAEKYSSAYHEGEKST
jgi:cell division septum initiation protein DivIVA